MRLHFFLRNTFLLLVAAPPWALRAQFQDPTPDELKMISEPKAPGAAAIYLYREETTNANNGIRTYYARIKVLAEKGKELATVKIPFEPGYAKVKKVEGRTIHSDGTVIPLSVKPEDVVDFKSKYFQEDSMVFTLPSADVGSILEYRLQIEYPHGVDPPRWELQYPWFIHKEHFFYAPDSSDSVWRNGRGQVLNRLVALTTPPGTPVSIETVKGRSSVDLTDVPPLPDDDWMPPINTRQWRVEFYYTYAKTTKEFWDTEAKFWAQGVDEFAQVTGTIRKAADSLVSPGDTDEQKARKIYAAVQNLDNTDFSRVKSDAERKKEKLKEVNSVEDVWKNRAGVGNSIALLYVALARAAGLKVWPMEIVDRSNAIFDVTYLAEDQLEDYIAIVNLGGKEVYIDPAQKDCPFGTLHWAHTLAGGFRESDTGPEIAWTPAAGYKENSVRRSANLTVDVDGNVTGAARVAMIGAEALYWRQRLLENDLEEVKKQFNEDLQGDLPEGVDCTFDHFIGLEDYEANLVALVTISGKIGEATGKRMILPGLFFESRAKHPFVAEDKRATPIDVHYPRMETDDVVYHLPQGYAVESSPARADVSWPGAAALRIQTVPKADSVEIGRVLGRNFTLIDSDKYNDLHNFYLKLAAADQQQIVLVRAAATKGSAP